MAFKISVTSYVNDPPAESVEARLCELRKWFFRFVVFVSRGSHHLVWVCVRGVIGLAW